jgi:hypothetical protein
MEIASLSEKVGVLVAITASGSCCGIKILGCGEDCAVWNR